MPLYEFDGRRPVIGDGSHVYPEAHLIGEVVIGRDTFVAPGARVRADYGRIEIGDDVSVQDNAVIHSNEGEVTRIGSHVTLGHGCVIHNCTIADFCLVGMNAVVSDYVTLGEWAVVGEGAVVPHGKVVEPGDIMLGVPAKAVGKVTEEYKANMSGPRGALKYGDAGKLRRL